MDIKNKINEIYESVKKGDFILAFDSIIKLNIDPAYLKFLIQVFIDVEKQYEKRHLDINTFLASENEFINALTDLPHYVLSGKKKINEENPDLPESNSGYLFLKLIDGLSGHNPQTVFNILPDYLDYYGQSDVGQVFKNSYLSLVKEYRRKIIDNDSFEVRKNSQIIKTINLLTKSYIIKNNPRALLPFIPKVEDMAGLYETGVFKPLPKITTFQVKFSFLDNDLNANNAFSFLSAFTNLFFDIDEVEVLVDDIGRGSYWFALSFKYQELEHLHEIKETIDSFTSAVEQRVNADSKEESKPTSKVKFKDLYEENKVLANQLLAKQLEEKELDIAIKKEQLKKIRESNAVDALLKANNIIIHVQGLSHLVKRENVIKTSDALIDPIIKEALQAITQRKLTDYFDKIERIKLSDQRKIALSKFKNEYFDGKADTEFYDRLTVFTKTVGQEGSHEKGDLDKNQSSNS